MNLSDLEKQCAESINGTTIGEPTITLLVRVGKSRASSRKTRLLAGAGSPKGRIVGWGNDFDTCFFNAREVLDFIRKASQ